MVQTVISRVVNSPALQIALGQSLGQGTVTPQNVSLAVNQRIRLDVVLQGLPTGSGKVNRQGIGSFVEVKFVGPINPISTTADQIKLLRELEASDRDRAEVHGVVSNFVSGAGSSTFTVDDVNVSADNSSGSATVKLGRLTGALSPESRPRMRRPPLLAYATFFPSGETLPNSRSPATPAWPMEASAKVNAVSCCCLSSGAGRERGAGRNAAAQNPWV